MASGTGTATIDFGAFPGANEAQATFTDSTISASAKVEAFVMGGDSTADHTAADHRYIPLWLALTATPNAGVGGTIYGRSDHKQQGTFALRYVWAD